jgi:hypothetical protein
MGNAATQLTPSQARVDNRDKKKAGAVEGQAEGSGTGMQEFQRVVANLATATRNAVAGQQERARKAAVNQTEDSATSDREGSGDSDRENADPEEEEGRVELEVVEEEPEPSPERPH